MIISFHRHNAFPSRRQIFANHLSMTGIAVLILSAQNSSLLLLAQRLFSLSLSLFFLFSLTCCSFEFFESFFLMEDNNHDCFTNINMTKGFSSFSHGIQAAPSIGGCIMYYKYQYTALTSDDDQLSLVSSLKKEAFSDSRSHSLLPPCCLSHNHQPWRMQSGNLSNWKLSIFTVMKTRHWFRSKTT